MTTPALLPCPWCDEQPCSVYVARDAVIDPGYYVGCETHHQMWSPDEAEAIAAWNRRHTPEPSDAEVEAVAQAIRKTRNEGCVLIDWGDLAETVQVGYLEEARAAIAAFLAGRTT